jgi:hypothetical protein
VFQCLTQLRGIPYAVSCKKLAVGTATRYAYTLTPVHRQFAREMHLQWTEPGASGKRSALPQLLLDNHDSSLLQGHLSPKIQRQLEAVLETARPEPGSESIQVLLRHGPLTRSENESFEPLNSHNDPDVPAAPKFSKVSPGANTHTIDLGQLPSSAAESLAKVINHFSDWYSLRGEEGRPAVSRMDKEALRAYLLEGKVSAGAPNEFDFVLHAVEAWAKSLGEGAPGFGEFLLKLNQSTLPHELGELISQYFKPSETGELVFSPPATNPARQASLEGTRFYAEYRAASGLGETSFRKLTSALASKGVIFGQIFDSPSDKRWGVEFFTKLGARLKDCAPGEAVACVCYHADTYRVQTDKSTGKPVSGTGATHVSVMAITPDGEVSISHHESIVTSARAGSVRNLMPGTLGLPANTYDTTEHHQYVAKRKGGRLPRTLPIQKSYDLTGPPSVMFSKISSFSSFKEFGDRLNRQSLSRKGLHWTYASDADLSLNAVAKGVKHGLPIENASQLVGPRFHSQPNVAAPGEADERALLAYSNNCLLLSLRALQAGGCAVLANVDLSRPMTLGDLMAIGQKAGLVPDTPENIADIMERERHTYVTGPDGATVLEQGLKATPPSSWTRHPDAGYPADVPRNEIAEWHNMRLLTVPGTKKKPAAKVGRRSSLRTRAESASTPTTFKRTLYQYDILFGANTYQFRKLAVDKEAATDSIQYELIYNPKKFEAYSKAFQSIRGETTTPLQAANQHQWDALRFAPRDWLEKNVPYVWYTRQAMDTATQRGGKIMFFLGGLPMTDHFADAAMIEHERGISYSDYVQSVTFRQNRKESNADFGLFAGGGLDGIDSGEEKDDAEHSLRGTKLTSLELADVLEIKLRSGIEFLSPYGDKLDTEKLIASYKAAADATRTPESKEYYLRTGTFPQSVQATIDKLENFIRKGRT